MVKKLKSESQLQELELYFNQNPQKWPKNQLIALGKRICLSRSQVYKWLWDQRNLMRQVNKNEVNFSSADYFAQDQKVIHEKIRQKPFKLKNYRKILLKSEFQEISLKVPQKLQFCSKFIVPCQISSWAHHILKNHGTQLIRSQTTFHQFPQKVEQVREFREVKEEDL